MDMVLYMSVDLFVDVGCEVNTRLLCDIQKFRLCEKFTMFKIHFKIISSFNCQILIPVWLNFEKYKYFLVQRKLQKINKIASSHITHC